MALFFLVVLPVPFVHAEEEKTDSSIILQDTAKSIFNPRLVSGEELLKVKDANFLNSLIGRMPGVTINPGASGVGGAVRVMWRGYRSIMRTNSMKYALDGILLPELETEEPENFFVGFGQSGDGIAAFASDDIESVYVLSTAAASVLYGSRSSGGVMMVNTRKAHSGKLSVNVGNSTTFSSPRVMPEFQNTYGREWEGKLSDPHRWDPADFFRTGHTINNSLSLSGGNDYNQTRFSAVTMNGAGLIPNNDVDRYNFSLRNTSSLLRNRLRLDVNLRYIHTSERNMLSQGTYSNPLVSVYLVPDVVQKIPTYAGVNGPFLTDYPYRDYFERYDPNYDVYAQYWDIGSLGIGAENPYWIVNRNLFDKKKNRWLAGAGAEFDLTSWLNVAARFRYDRDKEEGTQKYYASSEVILPSMLGRYYENSAETTQLYADLLLNIRRRTGDFSINATLGTSFYKTEFDYSNRGGSLKTANRFDLYALDERDAFSWGQGYNDRASSLFLLAQLGYKNRLYLDVGGRAEWLKFAGESAPDFSTDVFYPSAGISVVPTGWLSDNADRFLSSLKLNYTYSETGNSSLHRLPLNVFHVRKGQKLTEDNLKPERTKSHEVGLSAAFLKGKVSLDVTIYKTSTSDLPFEVSYQSEHQGKESAILRGCRMENKGIEFVLGTNMALGQAMWNGRLTYSLNKNKIKKLAEEHINPITGESVKLTEVEMFTDRGCSVLLKEGGSVGDIYVRDLQRDDAGNVVVDKASQNVTVSNEYVYAGNPDPKYTMGLANSFSWKGFELDFVIHARFGGTGVSLTQSVLDAHGVSKATAVARDNGGVWVSGTQIPAKNYYQAVAMQAGSPYTYDATNIRLAEMSLAYHIPINRWVKWMQDIRVALTGRNLLMLYNKAPFDPESTANTGTWGQGFDYFRQPSYRNLGFAVNLVF